MTTDVFNLEVLEDPEVHEMASDAIESELMGTEPADEATINSLLQVAAIQDYKAAERKASGNQGNTWKRCGSYRTAWRTWRRDDVPEGTYGQYTWQTEVNGRVPLMRDGNRVSVPWVSGQVTDFEPYCPDLFNTELVEMDLLLRTKPDGSCRWILRTQHEPEYERAPQKAYINDDSQLVVKSEDGKINLCYGLYLQRTVKKSGPVIEHMPLYSCVNFSRGKSGQQVELLDMYIDGQNVTATRSLETARSQMRRLAGNIYREVAAVRLSDASEEYNLQWGEEVRRAIFGAQRAQRMADEALDAINSAMSVEQDSLDEGMDF